MVAQWLLLLRENPRVMRTTGFGGILTFTTKFRPPGHTDFLRMPYRWLKPL